MCFTPAHRGTFAGLSPDRARLAIEDWADRTAELSVRDERPLPYISAWQQAPVHHGRDDAWLHCEMFSVRRSESKLKYLSGSESALGVFVNDVSPEQMAARLRHVVAG